MKLKEAREINGNVASWYMDTQVFGVEAALPTYTKKQMLEAFDLVRRANGLHPVDENGSQTLHVVCESRIADMVVSLRGW